MPLRLPTTIAKGIARPAASRGLHHSTARCSLPNKNSEDPTILSPRSNENTRSGTDDEVAALKHAPFTRHKNTPEDELASARQESEGETNPLEVSGANRDVSAHTMDVRVKHEEHEQVRSRHGSTRGKGDTLYKSSSWKRTKVEL